MRYFYLFACLVYLNEPVLAQDHTPGYYPKKDAVMDSVIITGNCWGAVQKDSLPLFIIDGRPSSYEEMAALDITTIQSIDILKTENVLFSCNSRTANGVMLIVTKPVKGQAFQITDAEDDAGVSFAIATFIGHKNDSIHVIADKAGKFQTSELKYDVEYKVRVTSIGYKDFTANYKRSNGKTTEQYHLTRDVKENQEVIVRSDGYRRVWRRGGCGGVLVTYTTWGEGPPPIKAKEAKIYPNPAVKGGGFKIEFQSDVLQSLQVRIFNLNGIQLSSRSYQSTKGVNRVEVPVASHWASGVYTVQVVNDKKELISQTKVVVQ